MCAAVHAVHAVLPGVHLEVLKKVGLAITDLPASFTPHKQVRGRATHAYLLTGHAHART